MEYVYRDFLSGNPVTVKSNPDNAMTHTWQLSPYASLIYKYNNITLEGGSRYNRHSTYGSNFTYTFNPSYLIKEKAKLFFTASSAFKAPSLYQLYDAFAGNKDLDPEKSNTVEGGVSFYFTDHFKSRITLFNRTTKNAIQYIITDPATFASQYRNVSNQKNSGVETEINYEDEKWNVALNYTLTRGKITSEFSETGSKLREDTTFNNLYRVPKHAANAVLFYNITPKINIGTVIRIVGNRLEPVYGAAPITLDDYYTIDFSGSYSINPKMRLFADFKNITDQKYFDVSGYNSRRFNFNAGLSVNL
jgi:vitamin B12 transporter